MGLFMGLLTLPLAPVRGVGWVVDQVVQEADRQMYDEQSIRRGMLELEIEADEGRISEEERAAREEELLQRLIEGQMRERAARDEAFDG